MIINAFHPDFMKTHYPDFWGTAVADASRSKTMSAIVSKTRQDNPSHGTMIGIRNKTPHVSLKPLEFLVYSKAGAKNVTPKHRKYK
jgi:hypothetical protein